MPSTKHSISAVSKAAPPAHLLHLHSALWCSPPASTATGVQPAARLTAGSGARLPFFALRGGGFYGGRGAPYRPPNNYGGIDRRVAPGAPPAGERYSPRYSPGRYSPRSRSRSRSKSPRCVGGLTVCVQLTCIAPAVCTKALPYPKLRCLPAYLSSPLNTATVLLLALPPRRYDDRYEDEQPPAKRRRYSRSPSRCALECSAKRCRPAKCCLGACPPSVAVRAGQLHVCGCLV